jgi:hypothetical protein
LLSLVSYQPGVAFERQRGAIGEELKQPELAKGQTEISVFAPLTR